MEHPRSSYTSDDLKGLKVMHGVGDFVEGEEKILVLKDTCILDDKADEDELVNLQLEEQFRTARNLEDRKRKPAYVAHDDNEFHQAPGVRKQILAQYDEEIEEGERESFFLGEKGQVKKKQYSQTQSQGGPPKKPISLNENPLKKEIKDYYSVEEFHASFRKKEKKMKLRSNPISTIVNTGTTPSLREALAEGEKNAKGDRNIEDNANFVDDDALQESLARARRLANKNKCAVDSIKSIAKKVLSEVDEPPKVKEAFRPEIGLVISDTYEFAQSIRAPSPKPAGVGKRLDFNEDKEEYEELNLSTPDIEGTSSVSRCTGVSPVVTSIMEKKEESLPAFMKEPLVKTGMAATLSLLKQRGLYKELTPEQREREKIQKQQLEWKKRQETAALPARAGSSKARYGGRQSYSSEREKAEVEYRKMANYKADIHLEYVDEFGNQLTPKEAYKQLSHKFHGKTPGKQKQEKRLQRLELKRRQTKLENTNNL